MRKHQIFLAVHFFVFHCANTARGMSSWSPPCRECLHGNDLPSPSETVIVKQRPTNTHILSLAHTHTHIEPAPSLGAGARACIEHGAVAMSLLRFSEGEKETKNVHPSPNAYESCKIPYNALNAPKN